jgi:hypothetical protein
VGSGDMDWIDVTQNSRRICVCDVEHLCL